jgi:phthiocerol/phenolphthiocerol synthesis type-I polyketide synthase C
MHASAYDPEDLIAIVGMAGRFPGAPDADSLWSLLAEGREAIVPVPANRWDAGGPLDPEKDIQAVGGFIEGVENFDAAFFGVSPREALAIDPQQRLMLEAAWRVLEDAGQRAGDLAGTTTGVYVGASWHDYELLRLRRGARPTAHSLYGNALDVIAARLSYFLQVRGPSLTVETGCSSSLVALHLAAQALREGEIDAAIVGGVNLMLDPHVTIGLTHFGGLSPQGRSRAFSRHADGFVRGEGVAALYLKTLARALADGDRVHAVVARTVVNNDGGGESLVTPSPAGQHDLLTRAYLSADRPLEAPAYIEAHGTGTGRGDPIEATAIGEVLGRKRTGGDPLYVGSIKTNIGHLEACAGMAGLFKLLLALRHRVVPPSLHAEELNPAIPFEELGLRVAREPVPLPADGRPHVGVNSFGWGGTNAHVVLAPPPADPPSLLPLPPAGRASAQTTGAAPGTGLPVVLPLSAKERPVLAQRARDLLERAPADAAGVAAVAGALARRRDHFPLRAGLVVTEPAALATGLRAVAAHEDGETEAPGVVLARAVPRRRVAFVFPGQGSQWPDMGQALHRDSPLFAEVIARCAEALRPHTDWDLLEVFAGRAGEEWTTRIDMLQPTLWAMSLGLAELWRASGVEPDVVLGHSQGEITAATLAGILSYEDAALVMARRSAIARRTSGRGRMLAVDLDRAQALAALEGFEDSVSLAVHNGPSSCVLSGAEESVVLLKELLEADGTYCRMVNVDYASHSPQMDPLREDLLTALEPVRPRAGGIELMSTVRAALLDGPEMDAAYWVENLRSPVQFADAMGTLLDKDVTHVVEISPHPVLAPAVEQIAAGRAEPVAVLTSLRRNRGGTADFGHALARAYTRGLEPFATLPSDPCVPLPPYPLRADPYWPQERRGGAGVTRGLEAPVTPTPGEENAWQSEIELSLLDQPWLGDHRVHGTPVLPATATLSVALDLVRGRTGALPSRLDHVTFDRGVTLDEGVTRLCACWREDIAGGGGYRLLSLPDGAAGWQSCATARVATGPHREAAPAFPVWAADLADAADPADAVEAAAALYRDWAARGLEYGPAFQGVAALHRGPDGEALGRVALPERLRSGTRPGALHPALWDAALHVALCLCDDAAAGAAVVPTAVRRVLLHGDLADRRTTLWSHAVRRADGRVDVVLHSSARAPLLTLEGLELRPLDSAGGGLRADAERLHRLAWTEAEPTDSAETVTGSAAVSGTWSVRGDGALADVLGAALTEAGARCDAGPEEAAAVVFAVPPAAAGRAAQRAALDDLTSLVRRVADRAVPPSLTLVTVGAQAVLPADVPDPGAAAFWGFGRVLCREHPELAPRLLDIDGTGAEPAAACLPLLTAADGEEQIALRGGRRLVARLSRGEPEPTEGLPPVHTAPQPFRLEPAGAGGGRTAVPMARTEPAAGEIEIAVTAAALSGSCAGRVVAVGDGVEGFAAGDRVVACGTGSPASHVTVPAVLARHLRSSTVEDAAAAPLPLAVAAAGYALAHLGRLDAGESVLVHVTDDPVCLAAVRIGLILGARVLATAAGPEARDWLRAQGVAEVFDAAAPDWIGEVGAATLGAGVDLMIGLPSGTAADTAAGVLAEGGRLVALGPAPALPNALPGGLTLASVDLPALLRRVPGRFVRALESGWQLVEAGRFAPLPVSPRGFAEEGTYRPEPGVAVPVLVGPSTVTGIAPVALPDGRLRTDGTYLITGGLGELGLSLARFMAERGAGRLVLLGRSGPRPETAARLAAVRAAGAEVEAAACDVADRAALDAVLARARAGGRPLRGVVHAAGLLADSTIRNLTPRQLDEVLAPKALGAVNLDAATQGDPLDFFVLFSSAAALVGNAGQAAYAAGNAFMDALAQARRRTGRPALSVQWGPFTGIGLAARDTLRGDRLAERGMGGFPAEEAWPAMLRMLDRGDSLIGYVPIHLRQWFDAYPDTAALGSWRRLRAASLEGGDPHGGEFLGRLLAAPPDARLAPAEHKIRELAGRILRTDPGRVEPETPFKALGLDSLMGLELRNRLESAFGLKLSPTLLWAYGTPRALARALCGQLPATAGDRPGEAS